jgi:predicted PurR-regulated permease PerM
VPSAEPISEAAADTAGGQIPNTPSTSPRPRSSVAAVVLATIAVGAVLWLAQGLILPVLLSMFFALIGNPIIRVLQRLWIPRFLGALIVLAGGLFAAGALGNQLIEPAGQWVRQAPRELKELAPKLREMVKPVQEANKAAESSPAPPAANPGRCRSCAPRSTSRTRP